VPVGIQLRQPLCQQPPVRTPSPLARRQGAV
jgi:hypothetical protein